MIAPVNNLIVTIEKKLYDSVTFASGQTIYYDPTWHPEEHSMLKAKVVSVPKGVINRRDYHGITIDMKPGDTILMRYDVIFAYKDQPDRDSPIYKNLLFQWNESTGKFEEFWLCDILQSFAIMRNQKTIMVNGWVILDPILIHGEDFSSLILRPDHHKAVELKDRAVIRHIGNNKLGLKDGDTVYFNPKTAMVYQVDTDKFILLKERNILGKVI